MGTAPNPNARRRNHQSAWRTLSPVCTRTPPKWPFSGPAMPGQTALWRKTWALPQAELWHEMGAVRLVARYAGLSLTAENPDTHVTILAELRQIEDRLLLAPGALIRARCIIAEAPAPVVEQPLVSNLDDYRDLAVG